MAGILSGVASRIDQALKLSNNRCKGQSPHYKHQDCWSAYADDIDGNTLVINIYNQIERNWNERTYRKRPSRENWRWKPNPPKKNDDKEENRKKKLEVRLEREIVVLTKTKGNWINQVPVASGLVHSSFDKRRAIDLIYRLAKNEYEFIELKVKLGSGHPLYAAMEILEYGVLYIFSQKKREIFGYTKEQNPLLWAKTIHLKVLAPYGYYKGCKVAWLVDAINSGLKRVLEELACDFQMDFTFEAFPPGFALKPFPADGAIVQAFNNRICVYHP